MSSPRSLLVPVNQQRIRQWNAFLLFWLCCLGICENRTIISKTQTGWLDCWSWIVSLGGTLTGNFSLGLGQNFHFLEWRIRCLLVLEEHLGTPQSMEEQENISVQRLFSYGTLHAGAVSGEMAWRILTGTSCAVLESCIPHWDLKSLDTGLERLKNRGNTGKNG